MITSGNKSIQTEPFLTGFRLVLTRGELDNPHQPRAWKTYKENFKVTMQFEDCVSM